MPQTMVARSVDKHRSVSTVMMAIWVPIVG
jgi:hypothetical protein